MLLPCYRTFPTSLGIYQITRKVIKMTEFEEQLIKEVKRLNNNLDEISISLQYIANIDIDSNGNVRGK